MKGAPKPRLCRITKWADFDGYGFHLQAIKSKPGQFIGKIDEDSPAEKAGLLQGDRIIEVNGVNINNENHLQVVERIKADPKFVELLVVDPDCYVHYTKNSLVIESSNEDVIVIANQPRSVSVPVIEVSETPEPEVAHSDDEEDVPEKIQESTIELEAQNGSLAKSSTSMNSDDSSNQSTDTGLNFDGISAAEMRARLAGRKRPDPRQEPLSAAQKHQIIQAL